MAKEDEEKKENETVKELTKSYEEKIANREKEFAEEKKVMQEKFEKEKKQLIEDKNKAIADIVLGRKEVKEFQNNDEEENDKSFFDKMVEETKKNLGITKGGKN